jgi:hypothetical protein
MAKVYINESFYGLSKDTLGGNVSVLDLAKDSDRIAKALIEPPSSIRRSVDDEVLAYFEHQQQVMVAMLKAMNVPMFRRVLEHTGHKFLEETSNGN